MTMPEVLKPPNKHQTEGWIDDLMGALFDPIITFPSPWQEDIPENLKKQIPLERLIMNMKVTQEGKGVPVGEVEALVYMFPRTLESPMGYEWTQIYSYCFTKAMDFMKVQVPPDLRVDMLSDSNMHMLNELKRFIYSSRVKHRKERSKEGATAVENKPKELEVKTSQPSFF